jgi:hypothetical protein
MLTVARRQGSHSYREVDFYKQNGKVMSMIMIFFVNNIRRAARMKNKLAAKENKSIKKQEMAAATTPSQLL